MATATRDDTDYNQMTLFEHSGILVYDRGYADKYFRLTAEVDSQLGEYYRALMPKYFPISRGRYGSHVTIVRSGKD